MPAPDQRTDQTPLRTEPVSETPIELLTGLVHEMNNHLTVITGSTAYLRTLVEGHPDAKAMLEVLDDMSDAARDGQAVLEKSIACAGRQAVAPRRIAPHEVVGRVTAVARRALPTALRLTSDCPTATPAVDVDRERLEQTLLALLANAREATGGRGTIRLAAWLDGGHGQVVFEVEDDGEGMSPDVLARATEPFFTTRSPRRGRGLGLSIARGFVRQSGGTLDIESAAGEGARVRLRLPIAR
ncbi:MAG: hypothetical protein H6983_17855 [Ectothiorhodospiraceae bacterium]|nr:hypothetical protein [Chromatiales bacterium]MCP5156042.1 hypothetical protein [Ectothiorhodospiraceae bacterium]